jgi:IS5 family transposase
MGLQPEEVGAAEDDQRDSGETWEAINRPLLRSARGEKLEDGTLVRLDSTVTAALMHAPSDSTSSITGHSP